MFGKPPPSVKATWTLTLDPYLHEGSNPLVIAKELGIGLRDTMELVVVLSDGLLALCDTVPSLLPDLHEHAQQMYGEVVQEFLDANVNTEDYPEDLLPTLMDRRRRYIEGVIRLAVDIMGHCPPGTKQLTYTYHLNRRVILISLNLDYDSVFESDNTR